jgi:DNA-binding LacI/PurR family transcriptional regulator
MISGSLGRPGIRERNRGYCQALFEAGIVADPRYEISIDEGLDLETGMQEAMQRLLDLPHPPDAVFCYGDAAAVLAMRTCVAAGLHVPRDISIVGFGDIPEAMLGHRHFPPFATT